MIQTKTELDFESQGVHYVVVTAQDKEGPETGRVASATVTILVQDTSDEVTNINTNKVAQCVMSSFSSFQLPRFVEPRYQATVPENAVDHIVTTVTAKDRDIVGSIHYEIISGDQELFSIDPESGVVRTVKGLDFEGQRMHFLTVSTKEARGTFDLDKTSTVIEVSVEDVNDNPPVFINVPRSIQVRNDAPLGYQIALVKAKDSDGTESGNVVRYEIVQGSSSEKATDYFGIDPTSGEIQIIGDLTQEIYDNYKVINTFMSISKVLFFIRWFDIHFSLKSGLWITEIHRWNPL